MSSTESLARFTITSSEHPCDAIEQVLGVRPSRCWRAGDPIPKTSMSRSNYGCLFESKLPRTETLDQHVRDLLNDLMPVASTIRALSQQGYDLLFSCVVYSSERPVLYFEKDVIASISELGSDFDIDFYGLPEQSEAETLAGTASTT